jgi:two-component system sensor histidine kinase HydH
MKEYSDHVSVCEFLEIIVEEVNVLNKITTDFLDFARPARLNLKEIDVNDVIFRTIQFMHLEIAKQKVEVDEQLAYDTPRILGDDKQLEQVLRNIVLNALQAMPKGGKLSVISEPLENGVRVRLGDSGVGMSPDTVSQIFVPFFTTRTKGTGLGLSIVHKIVDNHGGKITVESTLGEGTTFELFLPICSDKPRSAIIHSDSVVDSGDAGLFRRGRPTS